MEIRKQWEALEREWLSPLAVKSAESKGRVKPEPQCEFRTVFQRDRDRIIHCKSFRRLKQKTQVFLAPKGDHYRTRLTHTLEVAQVARTLARALKLNEDQTEAVALSHDLGHTPFGHIGEATLNRLMPEGFKHNEQSLRMVDVLENDGEGLNLTYEVRDGILTHSGDQKPASLEGWCVRRADRIAYINHDIDDAVRGGIIKPSDLPADCLRVLGDTHSKRINTMISDILANAPKTERVEMSKEIAEATDKLRDFLFEHVYQDSWRDEEETRCDFVLTTLFDYYGRHPEQMPGEYMAVARAEGTNRGVCDFLACMTDGYIIDLFTQRFVPKYFSVES
ncbi:MAG: deoxyguanosinetriphosphate triphosphohydrolase [Bacillota bacterium]